jgi:hypothetical protein
MELIGDTLLPDLAVIQEEKRSAGDILHRSIYANVEFAAAFDSPLVRDLFGTELRCDRCADLLGFSGQFARGGQLFVGYERSFQPTQFLSG